MKLLLVTQDFPPHVGGIQTYCYELARRLAGRFEVHVVAPKVHGWESIDDDLNVEVHRVRSSTDLLVVRGLPTIVGLARRLGIDAMLHAQWQTAATGLAARTTGSCRAVAVAAHGRELLLRPAARFPPVQRSFDAARRAVLRAADLVLPVSRFTGSLVEQLGVPAEHIRVIPNGVDPDLFRPVDPISFRRQHGLGNARLILTVGRLVARKGIDTVISALPEVLAHIPDTLYAIVGEGPERAHLEQLARMHGVADQVRFLGRIDRSELAACYSACTVFVTVSREQPPDVEGFGLVFLEANACGRPVIGADSGGIPDAVVHGETGLLVTPDRVGELTDALRTILGDREVANRMGRQGRARVLASCTWEHVADKMAHAIQSAVDHGR